MDTSFGKLKLCQKTIADFDKAISLDPNFASAYTNRGVAYNNLQQYQSAIADFSKAIALNPDFAEAYHGRASAYLNLSDFKNAFSDINKARQLYKAQNNTQGYEAVLNLLKIREK